jgi:hypothetical protein
MDAEEKTVLLKDAIEQVRVTAARLALLHLAFSRVLVETLGEEKGKEAVLRAVMEYGRLVAGRGGQDLPFYGLNEKSVYKGREYVDARERAEDGEPFDRAQYQVHGCVLARTFLEEGEPGLGALYCYVDAAKSMAADPAKKLIHTACVLCGDGHCAFAVEPTTEGERKAFDKDDPEWKAVDPILEKGIGLESGGKRDSGK